MPIYVLWNFILYCVVNAFTPGPGNILALNTVTNYGWKKGKPLFFGIFTGYYVVQILCAVFVYAVCTFLPGAMTVIRYIGAAYILWLAVHIALAGPPEERTEKSALRCSYSVLLRQHSADGSMRKPVSGFSTIICTIAVCCT